MSFEDFFGEGVAERYDAVEAEAFTPEILDPVVDLLAGLAGGGAALEFAIGTGRVALPLAARGVPVAGIELSEAMVAQLRAKPGGEDLPVALGDMASTRVDGTFRLVYLVFNTIMNLTSQEAQVACFANAAAHLEPGGSFVVEVIVPPLRRLPPGERHRVFFATDGAYGIDEIDVATQRLVSHHINPDGRSSLPCRYVWPAELDLMAQLAGMRLRDRWGGWDRRPFHHDSPSHVSVYER